MHKSHLTCATGKYGRVNPTISWSLKATLGDVVVEMRSHIGHKDTFKIKNLNLKKYIKRMAL